MRKLFGRFVLWILGGWKTISVDVPKKAVIIVAPHTSNWDFPIGMACQFVQGWSYHWIGKHSLFWWPMGIWLRSMKGIPVRRGTGQGVVGTAVKRFAEDDEFVLVLAPEGTRGRDDRGWKSGFYSIAVQAQVPLVLGYIDYPTRTVGLAKILELTGDQTADMAAIRDFYQGIVGKFPEKQSPVRIPPPKS